MAVLTEQEQTAARLLLSALIGFLAAEAPMDEQSFPLMMELLNCMEGEKEDGCQDAVDSLLEDAACNTRRHEEYYSNYQRYQLMQVDKTRVILACRIIINDLLGKLYRYDYRFGYNPVSYTHLICSGRSFLRFTDWLFQCRVRPFLISKAQARFLIQTILPA